MARETSNVIQQVGVQSAAGTPAAATKKFAGLTFDFADKIDAKFNRRKGAKFDTTSVINKVWTEGNFSGPMSYVEICYILAGLFPYTVAAVVGATGAYKWTFLPVAEGNDDAKLLTIEEGDDEAAEQYPDIYLQSLDLAFNRDDCQMSGNCFSFPFDPTFSTLSSGVTPLAERPVSGGEVDLFMDTTFGGIGTTKLTDAFDVKFSMGNKRDPKWVLNSTLPSFKEAKEMVPDASLTFTTEHNAQSRALRAGLLANAAKFFRIQATGPLIVGSQHYSFKQDFCGKIKNPNRQPDFQGLYGFDYEFGSFYEPTMGRGYSFEVVNMLAAL